MLTRIFTYITLVAYLVVGAVAVRVLAPEMTTVSFTTSYSQLFSKTEINSDQFETLSSPEIVFADIKFPVEKKAPAVKKAVVVAAKPVEFKIEKVSKNELQFGEPVTLSPVQMNEVILANVASLYKEFSHLEDAVNTQMASAEEVEPEFFEYKEEAVAAAPKKEEPVKTEVVADTSVEEISTEPEVIHNVEDVKVVDKVVEEIAVDELITFDYSKAQADIKKETVPTVSKVTTHQTVIQESATPTVNLNQISKPAKKIKKSKPVTTHEEKQEDNHLNDKSVNALVAPKTYANKMTIQVSGTDLDQTQSEVGFEVRFQDDLTEVIQDYNSGEVSFAQDLSDEKMTRSVAVLKRGFAPTNTDLILEEGETGIVLPLIEENKFNELLAPFESRGPIGAVLVELEDDVEGASLDVPYSQVLRLDENMKVTESDDFAYQLFVGVKAGNALLSYKGFRGEVTSKIIHIHERELTFETNFFEAVENERVSLLEEDLLGKEKTPLIISSEAVKEFATSKTARKINNHTYQTDFGRTLLGGRKYLELSHQQEPVFVGYKNATSLDIPSENFMRYILSRFENSKLGNRCLVQLNLNKKAVKIDVSSESVASGLVTYTQILDTDGKFYDSVSPKSRKVIVVGENQGAPEFSQDSKINFKITYQDGSVQYLGSYCSPNTYLVEQL